MKYTPPRTDKKIRAVYCTLFMLAILGMVIKVGGFYTTALQCSAVIMLTACLAIFIKYELITYTYILAERNNTLDFYVDKQTGKRGAYVCYFPLTDAVRLEKLDKNSKSRLRKEYKGISFYKFTKNIFTGDKYILVFQNGQGYDAVIFEPDKHFVELINNEMDKNKETINQ
ncbi:MAG: hypothetical protein IJX51_04090 [Clostridia bacterium]|nr:hypothetical protein [Clostridia bacterium]